MKRALVLLIACCASIVLLAQQPHWTPVDEGLYSGSTGIIAVVQIGGVEQSSTQMELAAFCGEECRGTAFTTEFPITHRFLALLNVYGENGHELTFKAYDHATNQELLDMNPVVTVVFSEDGSGTLFEPLEMNFVQEVVDENITFADANVKALCVANWDTDGDGELSYAEAAAVTDLGEVFKNNTTITSFDELQYFTGLTTICNSAFYCCFGLRSIEMPQSVISIDDYAFYRCQDLESLILPDSIQSIGNLAFYLCLKLTSLDIPNSLTYLGSNTFNSCYGLEQIIVAEDNTVFDSRNNCNAIIETVSNTLILGCQNTIIPNTVIRIGNSAFYYCVNLQSIEIPHSVTSIGEKAFAQCYGLTAIEIPNSVVSIDHGSYGDNVFGDCYLEQILVEEGNPVFDSRNNCNAIIETSTNKLIVGCQNTVIPNTVNTIGCSAFYCCWFLHSIEIPISVTSIEDYAFYRCQSLESLELPQLLTSIGRSAFYMCLNIDALEIPASVTSIGDYAFYYCTGLISITSLVQNPPTLGNNAFLDVDKSISVYVPCVSMYTYQNVAGWDEFTNYTPSTVCNSGVISVSVNPIEGGTVTGGGYFEGGAVCTLTANANEGYLFVNWTKDGVEVSNSETYSFNVDGDATYVANFEQSVVIGSGTATNQYLPSYSYYCYSLSQQIYTAEEIGSNGAITSVAFFNAGATKTRSYNVYLVHTDKLNFENSTDWIAVTENDLVFSGEVTMTAGVWTRLQFDTPFQYDGVSNIALVMDDNSGNYTVSPHMACNVFDAQGNQAIRIYSDGTNYDPYNPSGYYGTLHSLKNQIRLGFASPIITFADANVKALCVANWDTDGDGELSYAEAAAVTDLGEVFKENYSIISFDELQYFIGLTSIGYQAFAWCMYLNSIKLPSTIISIGNSAFYDCRQLHSIIIPASVISIGSSALACDNLEVIIVEEGNAVFDSRDNCNAIIMTSTNTLIRGCKNTVIPNTVVTLESNAFSSCSMTSMSIPSSVTSIDHTTFYACENLSEISVAEDNPAYDSRENCNAIIQTNTNKLVAGSKTTVIPNSVTAIGSYAFSYRFRWGSFHITIPESVTSIGSNAFIGGCAIDTISVLASVPPTITSSTFLYVSKNIPVFVPCGSISAYQAASGWSEFTNYQELECPSYEINATASPTNGGTITGSGTYTQGATCTLTATPNSGFTFVNWTKNGEEVSSEATYSFTVTEGASLVANFETSSVTQTTTLSRGWNWYSTYIEQEDIDGLGQLENSVGVPNAIIQSQNDGYVKSILRNGRVVWGGALGSINNEEMYKIGTKYICEATMEGQVTNPASHPITINKGWNWIGFPCDHSVSVSEALSRFRPKNGDVIKGIHSVATFSNGTWSGTLNTLEPGQGYMYGSKDRRPKTLVYQTGRGEATLANITPENNYFQPVEDYADNMTIIAVVELDGEELLSEEYELAVFAGDECRGSVKLMYIAPIDRYVAFLTVFGDEAEDLHFVLTDGFDKSQSADHIQYETDAIAGSLDNPAVLRFGATGVNDNAVANVRIYPNPSEGLFNIEGNNIRRVEVFNALGQPVFSMEAENGFLKLDLTNRASGIYLIRVITDDGICNRQVMKR